MADILEMTMEEYKRRMHKDNDPSVIPPAIPVATNFEHKGHILAMVKDIPFSEKDYEDAFKHIDEVLDIENYFNARNVSIEAILLRTLPVTFTGDAKIWLKSLVPGTIRTWTNLREAFI